MDVAGTAVGIASLGIQVCQSLLDYYDKWKAYSDDIATVLKSIKQTKLVLSRVEELCTKLDANKVNDVISAAQACNEHILKLEKKTKKLRTYDDPKGWRQQAFAHLQKTWYPLRHDTLAKLEKTAQDLQSQLSLPLQILGLDLETDSQAAIRITNTQTENILKQISIQEERDLELLKSNQMRDAVRWLDAADPEIEYTLALDKREDGTGVQLIGCDTYLRWKDGSNRHLWLHGKAGCGKSIASATIVEDIQKYCQNVPDAGWAMFYFTYNDTNKQSYNDCLRSLIFQLRQYRSVKFMLLDSHRAAGEHGRIIKNGEHNERKLEEAFLSSVGSLRRFFLILDGLDESPEYKTGTKSVRQKLLEKLRYLSDKTSNLKIVATSRDLDDIRRQLQKLESLSSIDLINYNSEDIQKYIETYLSEDPTLSSLGQPIKTEIMDKLMEKVDGMFRWVDCQLQDLSALQSTRPTLIYEVLNNLPRTLDETYNRMLERIRPQSQEDALTYLRWLAYAQEPLTLDELAETVIIKNRKSEPTVKTSDRGNAEDVHRLLSGLILIYEEEAEVEEEEFEEEQPAEKESEEEEESSCVQRGKTILRKKVKLAHYSVKEYLESNHILEGKLGSFHLRGPTERLILTKSCLIYLKHYADYGSTVGTQKDLCKFPLLQYAAHQWYTYQPDIDSYEAALFLNSQKNVESWTEIQQLDKRFRPRFVTGDNLGKDGPRLGIFRAAIHGLTDTVKHMLALSSDIDAVADMKNTALIAAAQEGRMDIIDMLIKHDTNVNAQMEISFYEDFWQRAFWGGTAVATAATNGNLEAIEVLIQSGAEVNAQVQYGYYGTALIAAAAAAARSDGTEATQVLIDNGADVNTQAQHGHFGTALIAAAARSDGTEAVQVLIDNGADVNTEAQHGHFGTALIAAARSDGTEAIQVLIDNGADVNTQAQHGYFGTALIAATANSWRKMEAIDLLIQNGAEVNAREQIPHHRTALTAALEYDPNDNRIKLARRLITIYGAEIYAGDIDGINSLHLMVRWNIDVFREPIISGACRVASKDKHGRDIRDFACMSGDLEMVETVLPLFSNNATEDPLPTQWSLLHWACREGSFEMLKLLNDSGYRSRMIKTEQPAALWAPLDLAVYYNNSMLVSEDGQILDCYDWRSILPSGIVRTSSDGAEDRIVMVRGNALGPAKQNTQRYCDGCRMDIYGYCFRCQTCHSYEYCFMCMQNSEEIHSGHKWECTKQ